MRIAQVLAILVLGSALGCYAKTSGSKGQATPRGQPAAPQEQAATPTPKGPAAQPIADGTPHPGLLDPSKATEQAPATYRVKLETTKGDVLLEIHRDWSPQGADRFYNLVKVGFFNDIAFFRALDNFMVQFGMNGDPAVQKAWNKVPLKDDPVKESNKRGFITFAKKGTPNSRTTQVFVNFKANTNLDGMGFSPFGEVIEGMDNLDGVFKGYGEGAPRGKGPGQGRLEKEGNAYLRESFPKLDYVKRATIVGG